MSHSVIPQTASAPAHPTPGPVGSDDEFSPLLEVVVGTADGARIPPLDRSALLNLYPDLGPAESARVAVGAFPSRVLAEAAEDLDGLAKLLADLGVRVYRPAPIVHDLEFGTPHWRTSGFYSYCPRDLALVVGSVIIATPSPMRARMFELAGLRELFQQRMLAGSAWIAAPPPQLREEMFPDDGQGRVTLGETEPVFDAANILRCGPDLFYLVSSSGNELGHRWLQTTLSALGDYRVHPIRGVYPHTHIDSTISLLREGLVLLNPERIRDPWQLPAPLRSWEHLWCPPMAVAPCSSPYPLSSAWIGMNLLMVRPDLAVVDAAQHDLIAALRRRGIDVIPHTLRHARAMGGGLHCVTLDLRRARGEAGRPEGSAGCGPAAGPLM
ncbi:scyllo-inosamine-4-phosphate amidinotransferase [Nocardia sp. NPDC046473]|uniref:scyllo-inosamine-4-phosphate amidinotransferase n=1 Tax=Nocardia sp. NPDC046473 TaxID=3155733 RepID=UPI0033C8B7C9